MDNLTLLNNVIAVSRMDFNGEEWNYIVLRKDNIVNNEQTYKVQWWSKSMRFFWTKNNMSFTHALNRFYLKVKGSIYNIVKDLNENTDFVDFEEKFKLLNVLTDSMGRRIKKDQQSINFFIEKIQEYIELSNEDMLSIDDMQEDIQPFLDRIAEEKEMDRIAEENPNDVVLFIDNKVYKSEN